MVFGKYGITIKYTVSQLIINYYVYTINIVNVIVVIIGFLHKLYGFDNNYLTDHLKSEFP